MLKKYVFTFLIISGLLFSNEVLAETLGEHVIVSGVTNVVFRESTIEEKIEATFWDEPRMMDVVKCESGFNQFRPDGTPLRSPTSDVGVMQINRAHWAEAKKLGLDIFYSARDNIAMGKIVYAKQGITAWVCNKLV